MIQSKKIHLPGLNGLRAIAALSVLWGHCFQKTFGDWGIPSWQLPIDIDGVTIFFVISGFLITYLLLHEYRESASISISKFYLRRILRIWPIYYGYIAVVVVLLGICGQLADIWNKTLFYYGFFAANIPFVVAAGIWPIVHYWSIGVEEQFYLFWPWLVKYGTKRLLLVACLVLLGWLLCKWGSYLMWGKCFAYKFFAVTRFDCMMLGAIGAIMYYRKHQLFLRVMTSNWVVLFSWGLLFTSYYYVRYIPAPIRPQFISLVALGLIMSQVAATPKIINLENKCFDFVGKISYGIYVIHPIVIFLLSKLYCKLSVDCRLPIQYGMIYFGTTIITIILAWISYTLYEKPFLRWKSRFAVVHSQNGIDR